MPVVARMLTPAGALYGLLSARRMAQAPRYRAKVPVICVGNFTAGGTGKTPFVRALLALLREQGHTPAVLSRGYGGTAIGPHRVDARLDRADVVGDEPLLLAGDAPVVVARDRVAGARAIESATDGTRATVIVMDDGLQNPALAKDLSFAIVDGSRGVGNGRCIPAGPLRAPLARQLPHVQAIVLNSNDGRSAGSARGLPGDLGVPCLAGGVSVSGSVAWLRSKPVIAYAGIGVPDRFFRSLRMAGADLVEEVAFPDHHRFSDADAERLLARGASGALQLVTTEKDAVRLRGAEGAQAALAAASRVLPVAFEFDPETRQQLRQLIAERVPLRA